LSSSIPVEDRAKYERGYVLALALGAALVSVLPSLYALMTAPPGTSYLGFQYATDDQMVYAAWMRQAMEGRFLFDNRFAIDAQPGLTLHLYFLILGWMAKATGIIFATTMARAAFSGLFVVLLYKLVRQFSTDVYGTKVALAFTVLGGGIGFLAWHNFGEALTRPESQWMSKLTANGQPIDVWQPEAFVLPSMLTNSLFMVSLCLTLGVFLSVLAAKNSWRPVLPGGLCCAILMNIHSYDVQIVLCVLIGLLISQAVQKDVPIVWIFRTIVIGLGALPSALWFMHVLKEDPVFQARAATETYTSNVRTVLFGYLPLIGIGLVGLATGQQMDRRKWSLASGALFIGLLATMFLFAPEPGFKGYFMSMGMWFLAMAIGYAAIALASTDNPARNLVASWALSGLVIPFFPALYERKLMMGLSIPWALLAALGLAYLVADKDRSKRNLATILSIIVLGGSSLRWFYREIEFIRNDVTRTTVQPVYLSRDIQQIIDYLNKLPPGRHVVIGIPGSWSPTLDDQGNPVLDSFGTPVLPDLNPVLSGYAGVYSFAGHWSETPFMDQPDPHAPLPMSRRQMASAVFSPRTSPEVRRAILDYSKADFLLAPVPEAYGNVFANLDDLGPTVAGGSHFKLIKIAK